MGGYQNMDVRAPALEETQGLLRLLWQCDLQAFALLHQVERLWCFEGFI